MADAVVDFPSPNVIARLELAAWAAEFVLLIVKTRGTGSPGTDVGNCVETVTVGLDAGTTTLMATLAVLLRPLVAFAALSVSVAAPEYPVFGTNARPLKAACKLDSVPFTVIVAELFAPAVKVSPAVEPRVSVPCVAVSVRESEVPDAAASASVTASPFAVEKTSVAFSLTFAVDGAVKAGGPKTVRFTAAVPDLPLPASVTLMLMVSAPLKPEVGVYFSVCRSAFRLASVPLAVIDAELLEPDVNFKPVVVPNLTRRASRSG